LDFYLSLFWLEIANLVPKFDILGVNRGQMLKLNTLAPKGTSLRGSAHFEPSCVKIARASEQK